MPVLFANPWGLLALLGVPLVLAVHFLHRQSKTIPVSTLFLIEIAREPAQSGRRWHRFLPSIPMWLQLLMVLLITALLARPYRPEGVLQIAVVIDESASMTAFRNQLADRLGALHDELEQAGRKNQWHIYSANPSTPVIYSGDQPEQWFESIRKWQPSESWRNPENSLRLARSKVGVEGVVIYATDSPAENLPSGVAQLSVGRPIDNVGIAGVTTDTTDGENKWQAVIVNHSDLATTRQWRLLWNDTNSTPPQTISLQPRGMVVVEGMLPDDASRLVLTLNRDTFPLDDYCPIVRETPKPLGFATTGEESPRWLAERLARMVPRLSPTALPVADFALVGLAAGESPPPVAGIHFSTAGKRDAPFINKLATPSGHSLVQGLSWAGLAAQEVEAPAPKEGDEVLLWADTRPLISLRQPEAAPAAAADPDETAPEPLVPAPGPQLILHFNPSLSNIDRLPSAAILMLRYAEMLRSMKQATTWAQLDPGQNIRPLLGTEYKPNTVIEQLDMKGEPLSSKILPRTAIAPSSPGFIRVKNDETVLLEASVAFSDSRESDFTYCQPLDSTEEAIAKAKRASIPTENAVLPLLSLSALSCLLLLYHFQSNSTGRTEADKTRPRSRASAA